MPARFQEFSRNSGFDAATRPDWLMVPLGLPNTVRLVAGEGLTCPRSLYRSLC